MMTRKNLKGTKIGVDSIHAASTKTWRHLGRHSLNDYRPIALLDIDYKIATNFLFKTGTLQEMTRARCTRPIPDWYETEVVYTSMTKTMSPK